MHQLVVDDGVDRVVMPLVGHDDPQAVRREPVNEEGLPHREGRAQQPDGVQAAGGVGEPLGDVVPEAVLLQGGDLGELDARQHQTAECGTPGLLPASVAGHRPVA